MQLPVPPAEDTRNKVVFLCTGNTCRSPMAEGLFNQMLEEEGLSGSWVAVSAGLNAYDGERANEKAAAVLKRMGADLSGHRSQRMNMQLLGEGTFFVCMEHGQFGMMSRFVEDKTKLLLLGGGIGDPYGQSEEVYEACARQIKSALSEVLELVKSYG